MTMVGGLIQLELAYKTATIGLRTLTPKNDPLLIIAKAHEKKYPQLARLQCSEENSTRT